MFDVKGSVTVAAPPERVSSYLADAANESKWQRDVIHLEKTAGTAGQVGATYERVQVVGGRNIKTEHKLVTLEPGKLVTFEGKGKAISLKVRYDLTPSGKETRVNMHLEGELLGFAAMFESMASEALQGLVSEGLAHLKRNLEDSP